MLTSVGGDRKSSPARRRETGSSRRGVKIGKGLRKKGKQGQSGLLQMKGEDRRREYQSRKRLVGGGPKEEELNKRGEEEVIRT